MEVARAGVHSGGSGLVGTETHGGDRSPGGGWWPWLLNSMRVLTATELHPEKWLKWQVVKTTIKKKGPPVMEQL